MDETDRRLLDRLQQDFPLVERPFGVLADELDLAESEVLRRVRGLVKGGLIRRIGPILDPRKVGRVGTLCAAAVPPERMDEVASRVSACEGVTHNYERKPLHGSCPYTLWFTCTAGSKEALAGRVDELSEAIGLRIERLPTRRKFKIGVRFSFAEEDEDG